MFYTNPGKRSRYRCFSVTLENRTFNKITEMASSTNRSRNDTIQMLLKHVIKHYDFNTLFENPDDGK